MPDLGWDIAETRLTQENQKENNQNLTPPLQTLITIIILIIAILKQLITQIKEITKRAAQATENTIKEASRNKLFQNIKDFHRTTMLAITVATNTTSRNSYPTTSSLGSRVTFPPQKPQEHSKTSTTSRISCSNKQIT